MNRWGQLAPFRLPNPKPEIKEEKERKKEKARGMWLACATQDEIAESVEVAAGTVANWEDEFLKNSIDEELRNWNGFEEPIYNIWKQQTKTAGVNHFGNSEPRWLENLLYLYTNPASPATIMRAVENSTVSNETVELPKTVIGKDGKERQAKQPERKAPEPELPIAPAKPASIQDSRTIHEL